jgi:hypothetical protein
VTACVTTHVTTRVTAAPPARRAEVLEVRLAELYPAVDKFVLVESGAPRALPLQPPLYRENVLRVLPPTPSLPYPPPTVASYPLPAQA